MDEDDEDGGRRESDLDGVSLHVHAVEGRQGQQGSLQQLELDPGVNLKGSDCEMFLQGHFRSVLVHWWSLSTHSLLVIKSLSRFIQQRSNLFHNKKKYKISLSIMSRKLFREIIQLNCVPCKINGQHVLNKYKNTL